MHKRKRELNKTLIVGREWGKSSTVGLSEVHKHELKKILAGNGGGGGAFPGPHW